MSLFISSSDEVEIFESCYQKSLPLLLKGPTGCGKSQLVEYMSKKLGRPLIKVACNEDTNSSDLLGRFIIRGGETLWQDGPVVRAIKEDAILYLDEIAEAREDVIVAIHPLTDHRREVYLDKTNQVIKANKEFMFVASFNPGYQAGIREMKPSTRQRFVTMQMDYLSPENEAQLLVELTQVNKSQAQALSKLANKIRESTSFSLKETVSTRLIVHAATLLEGGMNIRKACHVAIAEVLSDDRQVTEALKDLINLSV